MALVLVTFLKGYFGRPRLVFRGVLMVAFLFGCLDGLGAAGMKMDAFAFLPLFDKGLAWLMPTLLACVVGVMVRPTEMAAEAARSAQKAINAIESHEYYRLMNHDEYRSIQLMRRCWLFLGQCLCFPCPARLRSGVS